jgi:hypothetical protein
MANRSFKSLQKNVCEEAEQLPPLKKLCPRCKPNESYVEPDWTSLVNETYYNEKTCEYRVSVTVDKNGDSFILGDTRRFPSDKRKQRQILRRYINPAIVIMLEDEGKLVADQIICAYHEGPTLSSLTPQSLAQISSDLPTVYQLLSQDPVTPRCRDLEVELPNSEPLDVGRGVNDPIDPVTATAEIIKNLPTIKNPFALELYAYVSDYYIDPFQGLLKVLIAIPQHVFLAVPDAPSTEELEQQAQQTVEEVEISMEEFFGQITRLKTALKVYGKYQSYFRYKQNGDLNQFLNDKKYSDYYASVEAGNVKTFYSRFTKMAKKNGWNIRSNVPSVILQNARMVRFTFDGSDPKNPYKILKIEAKKKGCQYEELTKGLGKNKSSGFLNFCDSNPTTMNYIAKIKEIDLALRARESYPWLEFLIKFTYPVIKVDYGTITKESVEQEAGACVAETALEFGLDLKDYILNQDLSISEILDYEYNQKSCSQLGDFTNQPETEEFQPISIPKRKKEKTSAEEPIGQSGEIDFNILDLQYKMSWSSTEELNNRIESSRKELETNQIKLRQMVIDEGRIKLEYSKLLIKQNTTTSGSEYQSLEKELQLFTKELKRTQDKIEKQSQLRDDYNNLVLELEKKLRTTNRSQRQTSRQTRVKASKNQIKDSSHPYIKKARELALEEIQTQDSILTSIIDFDSWADKGFKGLKFNEVGNDFEIKDIFDRMSLCNLNSLTTQGIRCLFSGVTQDAALKKIIDVSLKAMDIDVFGIFIQNLPASAQAELRQAFEQEFGDLPLPWEEGYDPGSMENTNAYTKNLQNLGATQKLKQKQQEIKENRKKRKLEKTEKDLQEITNKIEEKRLREADEAEKRKNDEELVSNFMSGVSSTTGMTTEELEADLFADLDDVADDFISQTEELIEDLDTTVQELSKEQEAVLRNNYSFDFWIDSDSKEKKFRKWIVKNYKTRKFEGSGKPDTLGSSVPSKKRNSYVRTAWSELGREYIISPDGLNIQVNLPPIFEDEVENIPGAEEQIRLEEERQAAEAAAIQRAEEEAKAAEEAALAKAMAELNESQLEQVKQSASVPQEPFPSGTYGTALGNIQKLITDAYIKNIIDILEVDQIMSVLERFPGSELLPRIINYSSCAAQGLFNPPLDSFMKTFSFDPCGEGGINLGVPSIVGKELPNFYDKSFLNVLKKQFIKKVEFSWTEVLSRMLIKVLQTIDEALCKGLNVISQATTSDQGLDEAINDVFCPDGDSKDVDNTKNKLFKSAGVTPNKTKTTSGEEQVTDDSFDKLFKAINSTTSRREVMGLLTHSPSDMDPSVLRKISELVNAFCPEFSDTFGTPEAVSQTFAKVGNYLPPELRSAFQEEMSVAEDGPIFENICLTQEQKDAWDQNRIDLLTESGLDEPTAQQMIDEANERVLEDIGSLADILERGPDGLLGDALNSLLDPQRDPDCVTEDNVVQFETEESKKQKKDDIKSFFESIERDFLQDLIKRRNSVLNNILRDKNNFRLSKHELRTDYPFLWPNYADSDQDWEYRKENSNKVITWRMEDDRKTGFFPETVGIWMRKKLLEQTINYESSINQKQTSLYFQDAQDEDVEYSFQINYKIPHEEGFKKQISVDQVFYRKLKKREAEALGLDPSELGDNKTEVTGATIISLDETNDYPVLNIDYSNNSIPYQYFAFKDLLDKSVGSQVSFGSLADSCDFMNSKTLSFVRDAICNSPDGDIPSGFKFGYEGQDPITFLDLHYVNPEADPNDKKTWVYTYLPGEKVLGKSATENPRVHFLDPAIHGGSYLLPKIYIEPASYSGWLGMVKTFIPEVEKCEDVDNGFLNVTEVSKRVKRVEDTTPFDERLSLPPDCNVEVPYDKQFGPATHGLMEGVVLMTTKVYSTEFILKTLATFSSVEFSERNIDSSFTSMLVDEMKKGLTSQTTVWNLIQGYTYYLLFLEQACQVVQRQIKDGLIEKTQEISDAFNEINEMQRNFKAIKIDVKKVASGTYDISDILDIFRGSAIIAFGEDGWEEKFREFEEFNLSETTQGVAAGAIAGAATGAAVAAGAGRTLQGATVGAVAGATVAFGKDPAVSALSKLALKMGFLTPFKIELCRKIYSIHQTRDAAETVLGALVQKEIKELMEKINLNLRPRPHVSNIKKYLLSKNGIMLGSTLRSGESVIEQPVIEGATGFDYGKIFDVVRDTLSENPINQYVIEDPSVDSQSIAEELQKGYFYLERYVRVIGRTGQEQVFNIREFQEFLRNLSFDPESYISQNFGNASVLAGTLVGSIGIKFGVRVIYCGPSGAAGPQFDIPDNHMSERTYNLASGEITIRKEGQEDIKIPINNSGKPIPVAIFEQDVTDKKMSEINLDDENMGEDLKCYIDNLVETDEFNLLFEQIFPVKSYVSLFGIYSYYGFFESIGKDEDNEDENQEDPSKLKEGWKSKIFRNTKKELRKTFNSIYRTDDDVQEERSGKNRERNTQFLKNLVPQISLKLDTSVKWWQSFRIIDFKPFDADGNECPNAFQKMFL